MNPIPGVNYPADTEREKDEAAVRKALFLHGKSYSQQYDEWGQKHPVWQFAGEQAMSLVPWGRVLGKGGPLLQKAGQVYDWYQKTTDPYSESILPKWRHPLKRSANEELDRLQSERDFTDWLDNPSAVPLSNEQHFTDQLMDLLQGRASKAVVNLFRAPTGTGGNVPGRGIFHGIEPYTAGRFDPERGMNRRGRPYNSFEEAMYYTKRAVAKTVEIKKPLIFDRSRNPVDQLQDQGVVISNFVKGAMAAAHKRAEKIKNKYPGLTNLLGNPGVTVEDQHALEKLVVQQERLWRRMVEEGGFDSLVQFGGGSFPEIVTWEGRGAVRHVPAFAGTPGTPRQAARPPREGQVKEFERLMDLAARQQRQP